MGTGGRVDAASRSGGPDAGRSILGKRSGEKPFQEVLKSNSAEDMDLSFPESFPLPADVSATTIDDSFVDEAVHDPEIEKAVLRIDYTGYFFQ